MSDVVARIDDFGRPAWIALMVIGFIVFWPIGLAILAYIIWSGRMGCGWHGSRGDIERWRERATERVNRAATRWERKRSRWEERMQHWRGHYEHGLRPAAITPSMSTARRRCASWKRRRPSSGRS